MSSALSFRGVGPLRGAGTGCAGMQSGQESGAGTARFHAAGFIRLHVLCVWLALFKKFCKRDFCDEVIRRKVGKTGAKK